MGIGGSASPSVGHIRHAGPEKAVRSTAPGQPRFRGAKQQLVSL